jgi:importin subunit beta-1
MKPCLTVFSDLADAFPNGDIAQYFRADWIMSMIREVRSNREYSGRTIDTARWARELVKRQQQHAA